MSGFISSGLPVTMGQMDGKTKTTNADSCKRYRKKNAKEYKINDVLRKKRARLPLKSNKDAYEEHKSSSHKVHVKGKK